jgi:hypothetical protein
MTEERFIRVNKKQYHQLSLKIAFSNVADDPECPLNFPPWEGLEKAHEKGKTFLICGGK